jgi:hypothetical protein
MLLLVLVAGASGSSGSSGAAGHHAVSGAASWWVGLLATGVHTLATAAVTAVVALLVYEVVGLRILRTAWLNLDRVWALALVGAGVATLALNV